MAPLVPAGPRGAGRLGNFINGELVGRVTDVPWAMVFPQVDMLPRHPSQLYEFGLEGVLLFVVLWSYAARPRPTGAVSGLFLIGYGAFRFIAEFAREPDAFLGFLAGGLTMGQWLSLPMIALGVGMMIWAYRARGQGGADGHRPPEALRRERFSRGGGSRRRSRRTAGGRRRDPPSRLRLECAADVEREQQQRQRDQVGDEAGQHQQEARQHLAAAVDEAAHQRLLAVQRRDGAGAEGDALVAQQQEAREERADEPAPTAGSRSSARSARSA